MTKMEVTFSDTEQAETVRQRLASMIDDDLVVIQGDKIMVTEAGKSFVRVVCTALDERLIRAKPQSLTFSKAI